MFKLIMAGVLSLSIMGCSLNPSVLKEPIKLGTGAFISLSANAQMLLDNFEIMAQANPAFKPEDQAYIDLLRAQMEGDIKVLGGMIFIIDKWVSDATDLTRIVDNLPQWLKDVKAFQKNLKEAWDKLVEELNEADAEEARSMLEV